MSSGVEGTFDDVEEGKELVGGEDADSEEQESGNESDVYGSDRSDILDESDCSFGSDVDFQSYITSSNQDVKFNVDCDILWSKINPSDESLKIKSCTESNLENKLPELKNCPPRNSQPDVYFDLFFTTDVWNLVTNETNKFANNPNRLKNWVDTTVSEMKKYFALVLNMGITQTVDCSYFWKENSPLHMPFFSTTMPLERFKSISSKLHMSSQTQVESDYTSWTRFRPLLNALNSSFTNFYIPGRDIAVDESVYGIVPKYKSVFVSYTPKHHVQFGLKKYDLFDSSTGYILQSIVLSRADFADTHINPFMQKPIFRLVSDADLLDKSNHLFVFNTYPKLPLLKSLLEHKTYVTANVNPKTKELPKQVIQTKLNAGDTFLFKSDKLNAVIVAFKRQKKSRYLVTSLLDDAEKVKERTSRKSVTEDFARFSPHFDAVDEMYKAIYDLTCSRCTSKYWLKILYNLIDVTVLNSYILYKLNSDKPLSKQKFLSKIVESLVGYLPQTDSEPEDDESDYEESEFSSDSDLFKFDSESTIDSESTTDSETEED